MDTPQEATAPVSYYITVTVDGRRLGVTALSFRPWTRCAVTLVPVSRWIRRRRGLGAWIGRGVQRGDTRL